MQVIWSNESLEKMREIQNFISDNNPGNAERFIRFLIDQTQPIAMSPNAGRMVPELENPEIGELIVKKYRLVYRVQKDRVCILTVFEGHRLIRRSELF